MSSVHRMKVMPNMHYEKNILFWYGDKAGRCKVVTSRNYMHPFMWCNNRRWKRRERKHGKRSEVWLAWRAEQVEGKIPTKSINSLRQRTSFRGKIEPSPRFRCRKNMSGSDVLQETPPSRCGCYTWVTLVKGSSFYDTKTLLRRSTAYEQWWRSLRRRS